MVQSIVTDIDRFSIQSALLAVLLMALRVAWTRNAVGISMKSQILYFMCFFARYINVLWTFESTSETTLKLVYLGLSFWVVYLLVQREVKVADTPKNDTFPSEVILLAVIAAAGGIGFLSGSTVSQTLQSISMYLEALAILPQLTLTWKTKRAGNLGAEYLIVLGIYRLSRISARALRVMYGMSGGLEWEGILTGLLGLALYVDMLYVWLSVS